MKKLILMLFFALNVFGCIYSTIEGEKNKRAIYNHLETRAKLIHYYQTTK